MSEFNLKELENFCQNAIERLKAEFKSIRSNRPSVELIEDIKVNLYNNIFKIKQLGALSVRPPRTIQISVWDKNALSPIVSAIEDLKIGVGISVDGLNIYVNLPELTAERRTEFIKLTKKLAEESRIQIRNKRDEIIKKLKIEEKNKTISEDEVFKTKEKIQKIIDDTNLKIESLLKEKIEELNS